MSVLLVQGDARQIGLADASVHCCVCSPPYWNLRDYQTGTWVGGDPACLHAPSDTPQRRGLASSTLRGGKATTGHQQEGYAVQCPRCGAQRVDQQIGLSSRHDCLAWARQEPPCAACYLCSLRMVFGEVWRVLRNDGVLFVVIGDSYNAAGRTGHGTRIGYKQQTNRASAAGQDTCRATAPGLKPKDLCGIPHRLSLALQADGWTWRSDIIWHKRNAFPQSQQDRPTNSYEHVLLFSKRAQYFWDATAIQEPARAQENRGGCHTVQQLVTQPGAKNDGFGERYEPTGYRTCRDVWDIPTESSGVPHYATFPVELARRAILAGTSAHGVCSARGCGAPWRRVQETVVSWQETAYQGTQAYTTVNRMARAHSRRMSQSIYHEVGWAPTCTHDAPVTPAIVLDPFTGASSTLVAAQQLGRHGIGMDLSWTYLHRDSRERLSLAALAAWQGTPSTPPLVCYDDLPLFGRGHTHVTGV